MRRLFVIMLIAIMLLSHGGVAGLLPHAEAAHSHSDEGEHFPLIVAEAGENPVNVSADLPTSDDMAPAAASHIHVSAEALESDVLLASYRRARDLPQPGDVSLLTGREVPPAPEPPFA